MKRLKQILNNIIISSSYKNSTIEIQRKITLISLISLVGIISLTSLGITAFFQNNITVGVFDLFTGLMLVITQILIRRKNRYNLAANFGMLFISLHFVFLFATGGVNNSAFVWYYTYPLIANFILGSKKGLILSIILLLIAIVIVFIGPYVKVFTVYNRDLLTRFFPSLLVIILISYIFENIREKTQKKLSSKNKELNETIAELKKYEDKLLKAREGLEKRVHERTASLAKINKQLEKEIEERKKTENERKQLEVKLIQAQKMEAIGTLVGGVAHDLNNILSALVNYPELLLLKIPEDSPIRKTILTIKRSGEKAAAIVQDLLTLARRSVPIIEIVNINDIIVEYLNSPEYKKLKSYCPELIVETEMQKDLLNIKGSPVHLSKIIMNLVSNGVESMPDGGKLIISTDNKYIDIPINGYDEILEGDFVCIKITDTGIGMSSDELNRIFEPFYTRKTMGRSGTGLGMSVVWGTIKDHKGYINVKSEKEKGTTFTIYLPATREQNDNHKPETKIEDYYGRNEIVLVVDDIKDQREIAKDMLTILNYSVVLASSGGEAIEYLKTNTVDILLLDMIMDDGMDGYETYKRILEIHPGQKAIIASGFSETDRVKQALKLGAGAYIKKPYLLKILGKAIRSELK